MPEILVVLRAEGVEAAMRALVEVLLAFGNLAERDVRRRQHLLDLDAGEVLQRQRIGVGVDRAAHQQIAADFAPGRVGQRLIDAQLVQPRAAFEMEIVQAGRRSRCRSW